MPGTLLVATRPGLGPVCGIGRPSFRSGRRQPRCHGPGGTTRAGRSGRAARERAVPRRQIRWRTRPVARSIFVECRHGQQVLNCGTVVGRQRCQVATAQRSATLRFGSWEPRRPRCRPCAGLIAIHARPPYITEVTVKLALSSSHMRRRQPHGGVRSVESSRGPSDGRSPGPKPAPCLARLEGLEPPTF